MLRRKSFRPLVYLFLLIFFWSSFPADAVIVFLKNGRTLRGRITHQDKSHTHLELPQGGVLILENEEIDSIRDSLPKPDTKITQPEPPVRNSLLWPTPTPSDNNIIILDSLQNATHTPTPTATSAPTPRPFQLRPIKFRRIDKQEHRTLIARRFVYHIVVEEKIEDQEIRYLLIRLMQMCILDAKYADGIEIRLYGTDPKGKIYDWPFALAVYAPEGDWEKAQANIPKSKYRLKIKIKDKIEYYKI